MLCINNKFYYIYIKDLNSSEYTDILVQVNLIPNKTWLYMCFKSFKVLDR